MERQELGGITVVNRTEEDVLGRIWLGGEEGVLSKGNNSVRGESEVRQKREAVPLVQAPLPGHHHQQFLPLWHGAEIS